MLFLFCTRLLGFDAYLGTTIDQLVMPSLVIIQSLYGAWHSFVIITLDLEKVIEAFSR